MTDREDTIKTSLIGEAAMMLARLWKQHLRPVEYNRIFYLDDVRVEVSISEVKSLPIRRRASDKTHALARSASENEVTEIMQDRSSEA